MKRVFLLSILFAVLFTSCNMGMLGQYSDYYYYSPNKNTGGSSGGDSGPGEDIEIPDIDVDPEKDPFIKGEWNKPDYKFDGTKFETWLLKVEFDGSNIPEYGFFEDETQWTESQVKVGYPEVSFNADKRGWKAQGYGMNPLSIYRYDHKNPLIAADGTYNNSDRLQRFLFYRIIGEAVVVDLDQYLIAVDTYSKFVFAYAKVTSTTTVVGNKVPNGFGPVESYGEKRFFYEYDPIGYVKESGELVLYQEYRDAMLATKSIGFFPAIKDPSRPMASEEGPGTSPYYVDSVENIDPEALKDMFKGKTYSIRDVNNSLILYTYAISEDGNTLTITQTHYYDGVMDEPQVFTNPEVVGSSSLKFGEKTVVGLDKTDTGFAKLKDGDTELELILDYQDPGPNFYDRVKNAVFRYDSDYDNAYVFFSADGKQFTDTYDDMVYTLESLTETAFGKARASYRNTKNKYYTMHLDGALVEGQKLSYGGNYKMSRVAPPEDFTLSSAEYLFRDYSEYKPSGAYKTVWEDNPDYKSTGKSLNLYTYTFAGDTLTVTTTPYMSTAQSTVYNKTSSQGNVVTYTAGTDTITCTLLAKSPDLIYVTDSKDPENGRLIRGDFTDYGPIFVDRVAGAVFVGESPIKYVFNSDMSITFTYKYMLSTKTSTYEFARFDNELKNNYRAVYRMKDTDKYYFVVLESDDNHIKSSETGSSGNLSFPNTILNYSATRQP
ncbi:MAG: hypothetical protein IAA16_09825 [Candidatus Treponema excrementipullorum]|uniref:Lipoprotein n=1 Tax=Candidatus Treponema excrementipullorum TaxID=2838768 RepID=A0A9E2L3E5_9SPIR|nr:hypothetical protein [Candidatus Treponema excrementipullorum]